MKILLTGSNGQLGHDFKKIFDKKNIEYIATDYKELDITSDKDLNKFFQENEEITHIINCAAYNDVDKSETDKKVWLLNAEAPKKLAEFSKKIGYSRNAIYNFFKWDRKKQIQQIFRKLNFFD